MTDRKGVLVRFPPDLLADLDAEAKRSGKSRHDIILARCSLDAKAAPPRPVAIKAPQRPAPAFGPVPSVPGSRLKKR
jgi:hypothetical protein